MAKFKFGALVVDGAGKIGGHCLQHNRSNVIFRTKPLQSRQASPAQSVVRLSMPFLQKAWQTLTPSQRLAWDIFSNPAASGHSNFIKFNYKIFSSVNTTLTDPTLASKSILLDAMVFVSIGKQLWSNNNASISVTAIGNIIPLVQSSVIWITADSIYSAVYDATSGTIEAKIYAGCKAAAMLCYYPPYVSNASLGYLYNWYAAKLIDLDINNFNRLNPFNPIIYRVPSLLDYRSLLVSVGHQNIAGGLLKSVTSAFWASPNVGASNYYCFSAIGSGGRDPYSGLFSNIQCIFSSYSTSESSALNASYFSIFFNSPFFYLNTISKQFGMSIRFVI